MSLPQSVVTASFTAFFGAVVLVLGQLIQRFLLDPIQTQRKTVGEIAFNLTFLGRFRPSPGRGGRRRDSLGRRAMADRPVAW